ncbi:MAG: kynB [Gammaproteobacteria bacterium]|jgi:kynurenine formamidase|nr:kynB [Gammaproteobacteria bacterium]
MQKQLDLNNFTFIDLTHSLTPEIPHWNGKCGFQHTIETDYANCHSDAQFRVQKIEMWAGVGTHMDAPAHCISGAASIADIKLDQLIAPCVVVDVAENIHEAYSIKDDDILFFESRYGIIPKNTFVLIHTSWGSLWDQPEKYRNSLVFPSVTKEAAQLLLSRDICGLGIDTLSPDRPDSGFPVHQLLLRAGKYIIENIANSNKLPPVGASIIALPLKMKDVTESPIRLIGVVNK